MVLVESYKVKKTGKKVPQGKKTTCEGLYQNTSTAEGLI